MKRAYLVVLVLISGAILITSGMLFRSFVPDSFQVKGATSHNDYLMPSTAIFTSMGKNKDNKDVLIYSTSLSKDQVSKFYSELAQLRVSNNTPCISSIDFTDESVNNRLVKVTFCK